MELIDNVLYTHKVTDINADIDKYQLNVIISSIPNPALIDFLNIQNAFRNDKTRFIPIECFDVNPHNSQIKNLIHLLTSMIESKENKTQ